MIYVPVAAVFTVPLTVAVLVPSTLSTTVAPSSV